MSGPLQGSCISTGAIVSSVQGFLHMLINYELPLDVKDRILAYLPLAGIFERCAVCMTRPCRLRASLRAVRTTRQRDNQAAHIQPVWRLCKSAP